MEVSLKTGIRAALVLLALSFAADLAANEADYIRTPPPPRTLDVPAEWLQFPIDWKPTWDETWKTNYSDAWPQQLRQDKRFANMAEQIAGFRKIELLQQMIKRFPGDKDNQITAYCAIADTFGRLGLHWWQAWWGKKLVEDFPDNTNAVSRGYSYFRGWGQFGMWFYWIHPDLREWEWGLHNAIDRYKAGKLPAQETAWAYSGLASVYADLMDYGQFHPLLRKMKELNFPQVSNQLMEQLGHGADGEAEVILNSSGPNQLEFELEMRWEAAQHGDLYKDGNEPVRADEIQNLLDLISRTDARFKQGKRLTPYWTVLDQRLLEVPRSRLRPLIESQQKSAARMVEGLQRAGDANELFRTFRRYPFALCLQKLMIEQAEQEIRTGKCNWAVPAMREVARHADEDAVRLQAVVALWLALAQDPSGIQELKASMASVPDDTMVEWRGETLKAISVKTTLLAQTVDIANAAPLTLAQLPRRKILLPADWPSRELNFEGPHNDSGVHAPWPVSQVEKIGRSVIVSCSTAVARYDDDGATPAWYLNLPQNISRPDARDRFVSSEPQHARHFIRRPVRTRYSPRIPDSGRLYYLFNTQFPPVVAAVDLFTGKIIWSSEGRHGWEGLMPLSQPVCAGGSLYVLAAPTELPRLTVANAPAPGEAATMYVVCLDASEGRVLWKRKLGSRDGSAVDLARGSSSLLVHEGNVYCGTETGLLASLGANDGMVEWLQPYPLAVHQRGGVISVNPIRGGLGPLMVRAPGAGRDDYVLISAPRDHSGILAFNRKTGKLLWETPLVPSDKLVGVAGKTVIGISAFWLTGLDLDSGNQVYCREFPEGTGSQATLTGGNVVLVSGGKACRIESSTGKTIEELDLNAGLDAEFTIVPDGTIVQVVPPSLIPAPGPSTAGRELKLPVKEVWTLPADNPQLFFREDPADKVEAFGVVSGRRVALVKRTPNWHAAWERLLPIHPQTAVWTGDRLVTAHKWTATSLGATDGKPQWTSRLPVIAASMGGDNRLVYAASCPGPGGQPYYAFVEAATGKRIWDTNVGSWKFGFTMQTLLRREPDDSPVLRVISRGMAFPDVGGRSGEALIEAGTGQVKARQPLVPQAWDLWSPVNYDPAGIGFIGNTGMQGRLFAVPYSGGTNLIAGWERTLDLTPLRWLSRYVGVNCRGSGYYARLPGQLLFYDTASKREISYDLSRQGNVIQPFIFDFREQGDKVIVVTGFLFLQAPAPQAHSPTPTLEDNWRMFVDVFDRATGKNIMRQTLPGVMSCVKIIAYQEMAGYETTVRILDDSIIVSDINGVHVFTSEN